MSRDANSQEEVLLKRTNDLETVIQGLQKEIRQVNDTKGEIEVGLKREMASSEERENVLKMKVAELQGLIDQMTVSTQNEIATSLKLHKKAILELEDRITVLMKEKDEIAERQRSFPERYRAGTLVSCVILIKISLHLRRYMISLISKRTWFPCLWKMPEICTNRRQLRRITRLRG
jgi:hypothetical protein